MAAPNAPPRSAFTPDQLTRRSTAAKRAADQIEDDTDITGVEPAFPLTRILFAGPEGWVENYQGEGEVDASLDNDRDSAVVTLEKLVYFVCHQLGDIDLHRLLKEQRARSWELKYKKTLEKNHQSKWQSRILTGYLLHFVEKVWTKKKEEGVDLFQHPHNTTEERAKMWREIWVSGPPLKICQDMWQPVASAIDLETILNPPATATEADKAILKAWKQWLFNNFTQMADLTLDYRVRVRRVTAAEMLEFEVETKTLLQADAFVMRQWLRQSKDLPHPPIEQVPVPATKATSKRASRPLAKKARTLLPIAEAP